jgi:glycosyltransferase involved in cell wall biosynthesis
MMDDSTKLGTAVRPLHVLEILGNAIVGGMETYVTRLCGYLQPPAFRVSALCPFEGPATETLRRQGCHVLIAPVTDDPTWSTVQTAVTYVTTEHVDVMHAHLGNAHVLGLLTSALTGVGCVATVHGRSVPMLDLEAHRLLDRMHISVVCQAAYNHARALGIAADRLRLIPNGVPSSDAAADAHALHKVLGVPASTTILGFVGRLAPEKGPDMFLRMAWLLRAKHPDIRYVIAGDGPLRDALERQSRELLLNDRVHFLGVRNDVPLLLPSLAILVMPSHAEGLPLALMEAMAAGVPVVASSVGGIPELVAHTSTGLVVPPNDVHKLTSAVMELLNQPRQLAAMREASRLRAAQWPLDAASQAMAAYLREVAQDAQHQPKASLARAPTLSKRSVTPVPARSA